MKRFLIVAVLGLLSFGLMAQNYVTGTVTSADTIYGTGNITITLPEILVNGKYDISAQIVPTAYSVGDSVNAVIEVFQSNSVAGTTYTEVTTKQDTVTAVTGTIVELSDFLGARLRLKLTGISTDTIFPVRVDYIYKKNQ